MSFVRCSVALWEVVQLIIITERCWWSAGNALGSVQSNRSYSIKFSVHLLKENTANTTQFGLHVSAGNKCEISVYLTWTFWGFQYYSCSCKWGKNILPVSISISLAANFPLPQPTLAVPHIDVLEMPPTQVIRVLVPVTFPQLFFFSCPCTHSAFPEKAISCILQDHWSASSQSIRTCTKFHLSELMSRIAYKNTLKKWDKS